jgi:hypothetical protein
MPDETIPRVPQSSSQTAGWLDGAPGGDLNLDDLFPNPETRLQAQPQPPPAVPQAPPPVPQPFMRTQTGSVYNSAEDAIRGIEEKDRIIAQLRAEEAGRRGVDPLRRQPEAENPKQVLFKRLAKAAETGDYESYVDTLEQVTRQTLAPYAPMIAEVGREKIIRASATENPQLREFLESPEYTAVLERRPLLAQAIQAAENNPDATQQLQEFYGLAYTDALSRRPAPVLQAPTTPNPRPTLSHTTPTPQPPMANGGYMTEAQLYSKEGRKAILENGRARGIADADWGKVGL